MQLKIVTHFLLVSCFISCVMAKALYPGGCYECEEEVWEEVPCDDIPSNSTTISPPPPPCYQTTTTPQPPTTAVTDPITTAIPTTTTPATTIPTTTIPITTMSIPTTTTPSPVETTTPIDPYKKCYCECKIGCKEFCRKVVVNPDPKVHVVQVSKITAPIAHGPIEYTHYHHRELLPKPYYDKNHGSYNDEPEPQMEIYNEIAENNIYPNKYSTSTQAPPATIYRETISKKHSYNYYPKKPKLTNYPKPQPTPVPSYPVYDKAYAHAEAGFNKPYSPQTKSHPPSKYYAHSAPYDFPVPLEKIYTKVSKSLHRPADHTGPTYADLTPTQPKPNCPTSGYSQSVYTPPISDVYISNSPQYEDSFNALINEFLENNPLNAAAYENKPSNAAPYEPYSSPFYSVSYSR